MRNVQNQEETTENVDMREGWMIHDRQAVTSTIRALEVLALGIVGRSLERHPTMQMRALGNVMSRVADARTRSMLGLVKDEDTSDEARMAMEQVVQVAGWLAGERPEPVAALDQLHAAVFWFDSRLNSAGLSGGGWLRDLAKGD